MATAITSPEEQGRNLTADEAAGELYQVLEGHFDSLGLTDDERDARYAAAEQHVNSADAGSAKSATSS